MTTNTAAGGTDLGRRICEQRDRVGLSLAETAERAGLAVEYLAYLESSQDANPTQATRVRLAAALGTSAGVLSGARPTLPPGQRGATANPTLTRLSAEECIALIAPGGVGRMLFVEPIGDQADPLSRAVAAEAVCLGWSRHRSSLPGGTICALSAEVARLSEAWPEPLCGFIHPPVTLSDVAARF